MSGNEQKQVNIVHTTGNPQWPTVYIVAAGSLSEQPTWQSSARYLNEIETVQGITGPAPKGNQQKTVVVANGW